MSRFTVWIGTSFGGLLYWGLVYGFDSSRVDHFAGPVWFGGLALALHYIAESHQAGQKESGGPLE